MKSILTIYTTLFISNFLSAQEIVRVMPQEIDVVLTNPGIGFTTFQRFNGDTLNHDDAWTEGLPIEYQEFNGTLANKDYPMTSIAYFRVYWRYFEPEKGKYNWDMLDKALRTAHERNQTLMLRVGPYGNGPITKDSNEPKWYYEAVKDKGKFFDDVPSWYRAMVGEKDEWLPDGNEGWRVDAEDPKYAFYFGNFVAELGKRYDGHPDLESVDVSIVGFWGEGRGSEILSQKTRETLVNAYTDNFKKTPLLMLLTDEKTNQYGLSQANVGWRVDCIGGWKHDWSHMFDQYPQDIIKCGMQNVWMTAPVSMEICNVMKNWKDPNTDWDIDYLIDQTLKWHISSFNAKSSAVPKEWLDEVDRWLKSMGYRFVLRRFTYTTIVKPNTKVSIQTWWENKGVAPCYKDYRMAIRLKSEDREEVFITDANVQNWLPGDIIYDDSFIIPLDFPSGTYKMQVAIVDKQNHIPKISLAIEGKDKEGWYQMGEFTVIESR